MLCVCVLAVCSVVPYVVLSCDCVYGTMSAAADIKQVDVRQQITGPRNLLCSQIESRMMIYRRGPEKKHTFERKAA